MHECYMYVTVTERYESSVEDTHLSMAVILLSERLPILLHKLPRQIPTNRIPWYINDDIGYILTADLIFIQGQL